MFRTVSLQVRAFARVPCSSFSSSRLVRADVFVEKQGGTDSGISFVTFHRPSAKNALSKTLINDLNESLAQIEQDSSCRVVILRSTVDNVFCAGADLKERLTMPKEEVAAFVTLLRNTCARIERLPIPTIASIDGAAMGGGLEFALACDMRVASKDCKLALPETKLAIIPGAGGTQRLPRIVGPAKAKELILTGRILGATEAAAIGLVNHSVDSSKSLDKALELARAVLSTGPVASRVAKAAVDSSWDVIRNYLDEMEGKHYSRIIETEDRMEALRAFSEKRKPVFRGL